MGYLSEAEQEMRALVVARAGVVVPSWGGMEKGEPRCAIAEGSVAPHGTSPFSPSPSRLRYFSLYSPFSAFLLPFSVSPFSLLLLLLVLSDFTGFLYPSLLPL